MMAQKSLAGQTAVAMALVALLVPDPALASRTPNRESRLAGKVSRVARRVKVALGKLTRPLRPQKRPIHLDWHPKSPKDWSFVKTVKAFQANVPQKVQRKLQRASTRKLLDAYSVTYSQKVDDGLGKGPRRAAVHITQGVVKAPLGTFLKRLPAEMWGPNLDHYLGGEIKVYSKDAQGRPSRQLERMVLSGLPGNLNIRALNLDMSKVEQKEVVRDKAGNISRVTMYWRVHDSANKTTAMDIGSISFQAQGKDQTRVVFHSAHRLRFNPLPLPSLLVRPTLKSFFSDHVRNYRKIVTRQEN